MHPRPIRHLVDAKIKTWREKNHFSGDGWYRLPVNLSKHSQINFSKAVGLHYATHINDALLCLLHKRLIGRISSQFQGKICLYRCANFTGPSVINIPSAVRKLMLTEEVYGLSLFFMIYLPKEMHEHDIV